MRYILGIITILSITTGCLFRRDTRARVKCTLNGQVTFDEVVSSWSVHHETVFIYDKDNRIIKALVGQSCVIDEV